MAIFGSSSGSSGNVDEIKSTIIKQLQQEAAVNNARQLIGKVNEHCFDKCIPSPGSTLSSSEEGCLSTCMEKYISLWNVASKSYIARVGKESKKYGSQETIAMNSLATGGD
ncbi:protein translocase subunit TIM13 [Aspergillus ruber CBS 135680]|uniref:Mitochondrial import inner membrane translocase subunit n=1 Tax=Aspergillus ruber (strain CBS 135680) TaxID=1388766 RepID=A0A017SL80_ASPRC|nr:uncharacterized protein EURHEDRAFT_400695 [Aspergillus ruber CBS 135680]EYE97697.1 hypothetical protein EURHEDRAFT_400695 [Aspergillus ruber CBS 135680]